MQKGTVFELKLVGLKFEDEKLTVGRIQYNKAIVWVDVRTGEISKIELGKEGTIEEVRKKVEKNKGNILGLFRQLEGHIQLLQIVYETNPDLIQRWKSLGYQNCGKCKKFVLMFCESEQNECPRCSRLCGAK